MRSALHIHQLHNLSLTRAGAGPIYIESKLFLLIYLEVGRFSYLFANFCTSFLNIIAFFAEGFPKDRCRLGCLEINLFNHAGQVKLFFVFKRLLLN